MTNMVVPFMFSKILIPLFLSFAPAEASRILRPNPADYALISDFRAEWCAQRVCYGKSRFQRALSVRSLLLKRSDGSFALYVEDSWPAVEILKPRFGLVGPVQGFPSELGRATVSFDQNGEVEAVDAWIPSVGSISVRRP